MSQSLLESNLDSSDQPTVSKEFLEANFQDFTTYLLEQEILASGYCIENSPLVDVKLELNPKLLNSLLENDKNIKKTQQNIKEKVKSQFIIVNASDSSITGVAKKFKNKKFIVIKKDNETIVPKSFEDVIAEKGDEAIILLYKSPKEWYNINWFDMLTCWRYVP